MTEEELAQKFFDIFQNAFPGNEVVSYEKVTGSKNTLGIHLQTDDGCSSTVTDVYGN